MLVKVDVKLNDRDTIADVVAYNLPSIAFTSAENSIGIGIKGNFVLGRFRKLEEIDPYTLSYWDDITLGDMDFVYI